MSRYLTEEQRDEIVRLYRGGKSTAELAATFGKAQKNIQATLRRKGTLRVRRRYFCDYRFFEHIDSQEKAYWLGFLAADGSVATHHKANLRVQIALSDEDHLRLFKEALDASHPIRRIERESARMIDGRVISGSQAVILDICSRPLVDDLVAAGVGPRKTHALRWPEHLPRELLRHYLRGYFDGDGCWYANDRRPKAFDFMFQLCGNEPFLLGCQRYLMSECGLSETRLRQRRHDRCRELAYNGRTQGRRIFSLMYDGATVRMERKYLKAFRALSG